MAENVQEWYAQFVNVEQETLFELILAANYMDIKPLLDLTCATVASMMRGNYSADVDKCEYILNTV
jgi:S-phase kinase-associated protein 1